MTPVCPVARAQRRAAPCPVPRPARLLGERAERRLRRAFSAMLPVDRRIEPHLRGVISDVLANPGSLARAELAYGLGRRCRLHRRSALRLAIAVEYFHTASLLFDDLPSMDDATERRGERCAHLVHGEAAAILGALALVNRAYALLWQVLDAAPEERRRAAAALVDGCLGVTGILGGQARDLHCGGATAVWDAETAAGKTVPLVRLAIVLPPLLAGEDLAAVARLARLAHAWGLAYQILDDFKDLQLTAAEAGKTVRRDQQLGRPNLALAVGARRALARLRRLLREAQELLDGLAAGAGEDWEPLPRLQRLLVVEMEATAGRLTAARST